MALLGIVGASAAMFSVATAALAALPDPFHAARLYDFAPAGTALAAETAAPAATGGGAGDAAETTPAAAPAPEGGVSEPLPTILRSIADLPTPVREMRQKLIDAARSGDLEQLRLLMNAQAKPPAVAFGDPGDPIAYLKALSADAEGREILAILLDVLRTGFVHVGAGTKDDYYVWPYFAQYPLNALTPEQIVELYTIVTAADFEDMKSYGAYTSFRVGIASDGRWLFFLAGD